MTFKTTLTILLTVSLTATAYSANVQHTSQTTRQALDYLSFRLNQNKIIHPPLKLAVVFSIDDVTLSNKQTNPYIHTLFSFAKKHHVATFFISEQTEKQRNTIKQTLIQSGYRNWDKLYMQPNQSNSVTNYKINTRKHIIHNHYEIVLNIGSKQSDIAGGYADMTFLLS